MIDYVVKLHLHKYLMSLVHVSSILYFHKAIYHEEFLNHRKHMAHMYLQNRKY